MRMVCLALTAWLADPSARGFVAVLAAFLSSWLAVRAGAAVALRGLPPSGTAHWTERARRAWPVFLAAGLGPHALAGVWGLTILMPERGRFVAGSAPATALLALAAAGAAFLGAAAAAAGAESRVRERRVSLGVTLRDRAVAAVFFLHSAVVVYALVFALSPARPGLRTLLVGLSGAAVLLLLTGLALPIARWCGFVRPPPPRLLALVDLVAARTGVRPRSVVLVRWSPANALAFPLPRAVGVTEAALAALDDEEIAALLAHEFAHLREPRRVLFSRFLLPLVWLPALALLRVPSRNGRLAGVAALCAAVVVRRFLLALPRRAEVAADAAGKEGEAGEGVYARALEKLYRVNLVPVVMPGKRQVHPHLYDRMLAAGATPDYPRPAPPSGWRSLWSLSALTAMGLAAGLAFRIACLAVR